MSINIFITMSKNIFIIIFISYMSINLCYILSDTNGYKLAMNRNSNKNSNRNSI